MPRAGNVPTGSQSTANMIFSRRQPHDALDAVGVVEAHVAAAPGSRPAEVSIVRLASIGLIGQHRESSDP